MRFARHKIRLIDYKPSINLIMSIESNLLNQTVTVKFSPSRLLQQVSDKTHTHKKENYSSLPTLGIDGVHDMDHFLHGSPPRRR